jgi:hypothetical protein
MKFIKLQPLDGVRTTSLAISLAHFALSRDSTRDKAEAFCPLLLARWS